MNFSVPPTHLEAEAQDEWVNDFAGEVRREDLVALSPDSVNAQTMKNHITLDVRKIHSRNTSRLGLAAGCLVGLILTWSLVMADFYTVHPFWLTALVCVVTGFGIWGAMTVFRVR